MNLSKSDSGYFKGTSGYLASQKNFPNSLGNSGIIEPKEFDTREHPTKYKQLSSKKRKELRQKLLNRTITMKEYKRLEWQRRLDRRRRAGIDSFWTREAFLIETGQPTTRNWTAEQRKDILNNIRPKFKGQTIFSHHKYSVAKYPHLANVGKLIYPATLKEHFERWHGKDYKKSLPGRPVNPYVKEEF